MRIIEKCLWFLCGALVLCTALLCLPMVHAENRCTNPQPAIGLSRSRNTTSSPVSATSLPPQTTSARPTRDTTPAINNKTDYHIDLSTLAAPTFSPTPGNPAVLIVHTHGSEAYTPDDEYPYTPTDTDRTNDPAFNMIRPGHALATLLNAQGVVTLHDETLHDDPSYSGSYSRSLKTVNGYLERYPSIQLVIDLHRDAFLYEDGTRLRSTCTVDGEQAAKIMLVVGTDAGGLTHPNWRANLATAAYLYQALEALSPGISRPIDLREERFNQHVSGGALIVELGASGNTLGEALRSVSVLADAIVRILGT